MSKREKVTATEATPERTASSIFGRKIITNDLLLDLIISCCSPATLLCFSQTCRTIHLLVKSYTRRTFKIDHLLSRFFSSPLEFRRLQARTATLISGSTAFSSLTAPFIPKVIWIFTFIANSLKKLVTSCSRKTMFSCLARHNFPTLVKRQTNNVEIINQETTGICTTFELLPPSLHSRRSVPESC